MDTGMSAAIDRCSSRPVQAGHVVIQDDADGLVVRVEAEQLGAGAERGDREAGSGEQAPKRSRTPSSSSTTRMRPGRSATVVWRV